MKYKYKIEKKPSDQYWFVYRKKMGFYGFIFDIWFYLDLFFSLKEAEDYISKRIENDKNNMAPIFTKIIYP